MTETTMQDPMGWKAAEFRQKIVAKLDEVMRSTGPYMGKSGAEWESHLFPKAKSKEEYLSLIAKLIQHLQSFAENKNKGLANDGGSTNFNMAANAAGVIGTDPINALQNLTKQPVPSGMVQAQPGMAGQQAMGGPSVMGPIGARVPFQGYPGQQPMARGMQQGQARNDMFLVQQQPMAGGMVRPGGQQNYVMMPPSHFPMPLRPPGPSIMPGPGGMSFQNVQNQLDMSNMGSLPVGPVPSPAMVVGSGSGSMVSPGPMVTGHSPGPPAGIIPSPAGAPSPGCALNTPGNPGSVGAQNEEQAYLEKWRQLQKYVEPLKRMISRIDKDEDRQMDLNKMKNLLDILSDSSKRLPIQTLLKCEQVLEKLEFSNKRPGPATVAPVAPLGSASEHMCQPLLDAVAAHLKSPTLNHTLQRTFGPAVRALHGPPLRSYSPPAKRPCPDEADEAATPEDDIPDVIQGEIARLHHRFVVSLDPSHHPGSKVIHLLCRLEDKKLPSVPPIIVTLPENYPDTSPACRTLSAHYGSSPFLQKVNDILMTEINHMSGRYSLTALLNIWDICIRKACAPAAVTS